MDKDNWKKVLDECLSYEEDSDTAFDESDKELLSITSERLGEIIAGLIDVIEDLADGMDGEGKDGCYTYNLMLIQKTIVDALLENVYGEYEDDYYTAHDVAKVMTVEEAKILCPQYADYEDWENVNFQDEDDDDDYDDWDEDDEEEDE